LKPASSNGWDGGGAGTSCQTARSKRPEPSPIWRGATKPASSPAGIPGYSGIVMHQVEKNYTVAILSNLSTIEQTRLLPEIQTIIAKYQSR
jgi:hypothetical protein